MPVFPHDCCVDQLGETVQRLVRTLQIFERGKLTKKGFTISQCYTMFNIQQYGALTMNQLSEKMNLDTSTMTRIVATLDRDGYLSRERSLEDRRIVLVRLTAKGSEAARELETEVREFYRYIVQALPEGKVDDVIESVNLLLQAFQQVRPFCC